SFQPAGIRSLSSNQPQRKKDEKPLPGEHGHGGAVSGFQFGGVRPKALGEGLRPGVRRQRQGFHWADILRFTGAFRGKDNREDPSSSVTHSIFVEGLPFLKR